MLKNKFGMTKVLVLVLSVLMLVSLAACNKKDTIDPDAMNSAIQSAIDAANAAQAEKDAALASSIAADKAAQAEKDAAIASSIAADKAAQEEELKKAQEAAAAASKQAAEASKQAAEASKQAAEASKEASKANTTVKTTKGEQTTAPIVIDDKTDVLEAYSKLKTEYTFTKRDYYLAADYSELVLLFDKASVDLNNALTLDAAKAVLETLKVDVAAIESADTAAKEVQALIAALGDIETEVFTTQAEKIVEAREALEDLKVAYADYFEYDVKKEADTYVIVDGKTINKTAALIEELGVELDELENAESKLDVLEAYIAEALYKDMKAIHNYDTKHRFDVEDDASLITTVKDAYYKYLVLSVLNGGDTAAADMPIDWEYKVDKEGEVQKGEYDYTKPIEWFTIDELVETYILPVLDNELYNYVHDAETGLLVKLTAAMGAEGLYKKAPDTAKPEFKDLDFDEIVDAFEEEVDAISFVEDYKGTATLDDAKADINTIAINYYIDAMNAYLAAAKVVVIEKAEEDTEKAIDAELDKIDVAETQIDATESESTIARLNTKIEGYKAQIEKLQANLEALKLNVNAATLLTYEEMLNEELDETKAYKGKWADISDFENETAADIEAFLNLVLSNTIITNFKVEIAVESDDESEQELINLINAVVADLEALRVRVSPYEDDAYDAEKKTGADIFNALKGTKYTYIEGDNYYFKNTEKFESIVAIIDAAIAEIEATTAEGEATPVQVVSAKDKGKKMFFRNAAAKTYAEENELTFAAIVKDTTLWTDSDTGLPVQYSYTAAEQAAVAIASKYVDTYKAVNTAIVAVDASVKGDNYKVKTGKTAIESDEYKAILNTVAGALKTEVEAVANTYKGNIDTVAADFAKNSGVTATALVEKLDYKHDDFVNIKVKENTVLGNAAAYDYTGYYDDIDTTVTTFNNNFFMSNADLYWYNNGVAGEKGKLDDPDTFVDEGKELDKTESKVVLLWNAKIKAVEEIKTAIAGYKNTVTAEYGTDNKATGLFTLTKNAAGLYYYDGVDAATATKTQATKSAEAVAYEAALDALLAEYTELIMGIEISDGKTTILDGQGNTVKIVDLNTVAAEDATAAAKEEADADDKPYSFKDLAISYNLDIATAAIKAYKEALFGTPDYWVYANNDSKKTEYDQANSKIFSAYNTHILGNTYGVTRPQVTVNVTNDTEKGSVTISTPYHSNAVTVTVKPVATTDEKLGYVVKSITVNGTDITETKTFEAVKGTTYTVVVTYEQEIVLVDNSDETKGTVTTVTKFGKGMKAVVQANPVKPTAEAAGYYAKGITVKIDGTAVTATYDSKTNTYSFDVPTTATKVEVTGDFEAGAYIETTKTGDANIVVTSKPAKGNYAVGENYTFKVVKKTSTDTVTVKVNGTAVEAVNGVYTVALTASTKIEVTVAAPAAQ